LADLEVTEGDSRKSWGFSHTVPAIHHSDKLEAVHVVVSRHERVEQEELTNNVGEEADFDAEIESGEKCTLALVA